MLKSKSVIQNYKISCIFKCSEENVSVFAKVPSASWMFLVGLIGVVMQLLRQCLEVSYWSKETFLDMIQ